MLPIIRHKFHQTQRTIVAALKESLETHREAAALRSEDSSAIDTVMPALTPDRRRR